MIHQRFVRASLLGLLLVAGAATASAQYNPDNPPEPYLYLYAKVKVSCEPEGVAYLSGAGNYLSGTTVRLNTSAANSSYRFVHWTLNGEVCSTEPGFDVTVGESNVSYTAHYCFTPPPPEEPSTILRRRVYFTSQPAGTASFSQTSGARFNVGNNVVVRAYPNQGYAFRGWYEGDTFLGTSNPCSYELPDRNVTLTARFVYNPASPDEPSTFYSTSGIIQVAANDDTRGTVAIDGLTEGRALFGHTITVMATAAYGYTFGGWSDGTQIVSTTPTYSFVAEKSMTLTACFMIEPHILTFKVDDEVLASMAVEAGAAITPLAGPVREGYAFTGWDGLPEYMPHSDVTVTAMFSLPGDIDGNGIVNVSDAVDLIDYYLQGTTDQLKLAVADLDGNGVINVSDAVEIIEKYLHNH